MTVKYTDFDTRISNFFTVIIFILFYLSFCMICYSIFYSLLLIILKYSFFLFPFSCFHSRSRSFSLILFLSLYSIFLLVCLKLLLTYLPPSFICLYFYYFTSLSSQSSIPFHLPFSTFYSSPPPFFNSLFYSFLYSFSFFFSPPETLLLNLWFKISFFDLC